MTAEAGEDPQGGLSAHLVNLEADGAAFPDQPAEGGDIDDSPAETSTLDEAAVEAITVDEIPLGTTMEETPPEAITTEETPAGTTVDETSAEGTTGEAPAGSVQVGDEGPMLLGEVPPEAAPSNYQGEGVYVGHEPPEGFTIKGNERSMKYHVPESAGYGRTVAEVWFNSEEAAQQAGFVRAQR
jgi:hypothetical protein